MSSSEPIGRGVPAPSPTNGQITITVTAQQAEIIAEEIQRCADFEAHRMRDDVLALRRHIDEMVMVLDQLGWPEQVPEPRAGEITAAPGVLKRCAVAWIDGVADGLSQATLLADEKDLAALRQHKLAFDAAMDLIDLVEAAS